MDLLLFKDVDEWEAVRSLIAWEQIDIGVGSDSWQVEFEGSWADTSGEFGNAAGRFGELYETYHMFTRRSNGYLMCTDEVSLASSSGSESWVLGFPFDVFETANRRPGS